MSTTRLIETLAIQSDSRKQFRMFAYIIRQLKGLEIPFFVDNGNIYATKGKADVYPCMVSHMDTVHAIEEDLLVMEFDGLLTGFNRLTMSQTGIGGDDKVGVYITLEMLRERKNFKAVFFRDEEVGCQGSYGAKMDFFEDCSFVLQCDRKGSGDFITTAGCTELCSQSFKDDVAFITSRYGYQFQSGLMTDVMALKERGLKCSAANISCGYYRPHSENEYVNIYDVETCIMLVDDIYAVLGDVSYPHEYVKPVRKYGNYNGYGGYKNNEYGWDDDDRYRTDYYSNREYNTVTGSWELKNPIVKQPKLFHEDALVNCMDCQAEVAIKNGLCKNCYQHYTDTGYFENEKLPTIPVHTPLKKSKNQMKREAKALLKEQAKNRARSGLMG